MLLIGAVLGVAFVYLSEWLGARRTTAGKQSTYESGMIPIGTAQDRFSIKFYLTAVSFIVFDIEVVFMYPWAVQIRELGYTPFIAMMIFIVILLVGLFYEIKKGGIKWD
ncbi:MAG: NADH-quinone oxidoreductase subunit A [Candidatus Kapaibacteriales bacterium]